MEALDEYVWDGEERLYSTADIAEKFGVRDAAVRAWCRDGEVRSLKMRNGQYRIPHSEMVKYAQKMFGDDRVAT